MMIIIMRTILISKYKSNTKISNHLKTIFKTNVKKEIGHVLTWYQRTAREWITSITRHA